MSEENLSECQGVEGGAFVPHGDVGAGLLCTLLYHLFCAGRVADFPLLERGAMGCLLRTGQSPAIQRTAHLREGGLEKTEIIF